MKLRADKKVWRSWLAIILSNAVISIAWLSLANVSAAQQQADAKPPPVEKVSQTDIEFFENKVRPLLVANCLKCHGDNEEKLRGGLHLTSRAELIKGGDSGPAIVPGKPDESLLIASVRYEDFEMPPKGKLKDEEIEILVQWIKKGAPDPRKTRQVVPSHTIDIEQGKQFWAFVPRKNIQPPAPKNSTWPDSPIDQLILQRLETEGITPVQDANRETLIRRAYIALAGMPPTVAQIDAFVDDPDDIEIAFIKVVDKLLQSNEFGERWGRHWLDVVRFAESSGGGRSLMFPDAWRFRDYVIASFNADKPFDQFIMEQIAGDLLPFESHDEKLEQIVATGMLALGPTNYEQQDKELLRMEVVDEQVDTVGRAFMGLTLGCARCHDHKFDPIPMTDYYAIAGIFGSTKSLVDGNVSKYVQRPLATEAELAMEKQYRKQVKQLSKQLAAAKKKLEQVDKSNSLLAQADKTSGRKSRLAKDLPGVVIDDRGAQLTGDWIESVHIPFFVNANYLHDEDKNKGKNQAVFSPKLKTGGRYEVRLSYSPSGNRASNVPVMIDHQDGLETVIVNQSHREQLKRSPEDERLEATIESFELAYRMQMNAPGIMDLSNETQATLESYGIGEPSTGNFGRQCLMARRLAEADVRYIQINYSDESVTPMWDQHSNMPKHADHARAVDKPVAGLLADLQQRGLLEDTLVWWGGEFGRTPFAQGKDGRDHNPRGFTVWLAGGGVKSGYAHGSTDEIGHHAIEDKVHMHDLHATVLHLLGLDHEKLTYKYAGRNFRLTDVAGNVVHDLLA